MKIKIWILSLTMFASQSFGVITDYPKARRARDRLLYTNLVGFKQRFAALSGQANTYDTYSGLQGLQRKLCSVMGLLRDDSGFVGQFAKLKSAVDEKISLTSAAIKNVLDDDFIWFEARSKTDNFSGSKAEQLLLLEEELDNYILRKNNEINRTGNPRIAFKYNHLQAQVKSRIDHIVTIRKIKQQIANFKNKLDAPLLSNEDLIELKDEIETAGREYRSGGLRLQSSISAKFNDEFGALARTVIGRIQQLHDLMQAPENEDPSSAGANSRASRGLASLGRLRFE